MDTPTNPSLIETMHSSPYGEIALLDLHLDRLLSSAQALGYANPVRESIRQLVYDHLANQGHSASNLRLRLLMNPSGQVTIESSALPPLIGVPAVAISPTRLNSLEIYLQHKTTYRPWYADAASWLSSHPDFFDLVYLNEKNEVSEGSRSNVYLFQEGAWVTPPLASGLLGGVLRRQLLESGLVVEKPIPATLLAKKEVRLRLSNGLRGWFDVRLTDFPG
jgi:4-amino-4-deoxychorismate lyase